MTGWVGLIAQTAFEVLAGITIVLLLRVVETFS